MLVGYVRVSTVEQSEERQIVELREKAGVEKFLSIKSLLNLLNVLNSMR